MTPRRAYLALGAGLAGFYVLAQWVVDRRELAAESDHEAAVARAAAEPGTAVTDPTLPAGVVEVELVGVAPELAPELPATIRLGAQKRTWAADAPARFEGLVAGERRRPLSIAGPYAVESVSLDASTGARGVRVGVRAIPIDAQWQIADPYEKTMEVNLTRPDVVALVWKQGRTVVSEVTLPRAQGALAALAGKVRDEWKQQGNHRDSADRKLDQAVVRITPAASFDTILPVVEAVLATKREMHLGDGLRSVPVFNVSVQP